MSDAATAPASSAATTAPVPGAGPGGAATTVGPTGVVTPGAAPASASGPVVVPSNAPVDWSAGLPELQRGYVQNKGWQNVNQVIESYQNAEKFLGVKSEFLARIPERTDTPEGQAQLNAMYDKLGRPKDAAEYKFTPPKSGEQSPEFTKWAQGVFHKQGLSKSQGEAVAAEWNQYVQSAVEKETNDTKIAFQESDAALKREWGAAYEPKVMQGKAACRAFGLSQETVTKLEKAIGYSDVMKFMSAVGEKLGEDKFVDGGSGNNHGAMTPEAAKAEYAALQKDKAWLNKFAAGDRTALAERDRLLRFMNPE